MNDWAEFKRLREELLATKRFERVPHKEQRFLYTDPAHGFQLPVDFIPFGGVASENQMIAWPPEGDFVMNVAGFEEALASALCIELEPGLVLSVASLPGLAILKIIAWAARHMENNKDAAGLYKILITYYSAGNENRIYDQELRLLESVDYDPTLAGAQLLGRDAAHISDSVAAGQLGNLLSSDAQTDLLISHMIATASYEENAPSVARAFEPKSGSSNSADRAKSLKCLGISTASQFTIRVITDFAATACGLKIYPVLSGSNCRI